MTVICPICSSTPSIRGAVDADIVRKVSLRKIAERHNLSIRAVRRHLKHLPEVLETERATSPTVVIAPVYNVNLVVSPGVDTLADEGEGVRT